VADYQKPLPVPSAETDAFWEGCRQHKLILPYCLSCDSWYFYPRPLCPKCHSWNVTNREHSGRGTLYTYAIQYRPQAPGFQNELPYATALVDLAPGCRMMTNLVGTEPDPARIRCDSPVEVVFEDVTPEFTIPKFRLTIS
jgi:uncharacterized OB-fold protein